MAWVSRETRQKAEAAYRALRYARMRAKREPGQEQWIAEAEKRARRMKKLLLTESRQG